jgi:hypothetical protein
MIPNEYHKLVASQILSCDIERLDAAIRAETGHGLITYIKSNLPTAKRNNLKFRNFNLIRFASECDVRFMGKIPAHDGTDARVIEIQCLRSSEHRAVAKINQKVIFECTTKNFSMLQEITVGALHTFLDRRRRTNKRANAARKKRRATNC